MRCLFRHRLLRVPNVEMGHLDLVGDLLILLRFVTFHFRIREMRMRE